MDDDIEPPFDFDLYVGKRAGLFIELSAGDAEPDSQLWASVDERVFGFVEMFLKARISNPESYSHYGTNQIRAADWIDALQDLYRYSEELILQSYGDDRRWAEGGYEEIDEELRHDFKITSAGVKKLAVKLRIWTNSWPEHYLNIFIHGI